MWKLESKLKTQRKKKRNHIFSSGKKQKTDSILGSLLFKIFDYRFVYIFRDSNGVEKIGISKDSRKRLKQVDRSMKNLSVKMLFEMKLFFAEKHEKKLHHQYEKKWKPKRVGSGRLEFFDLSFFDVVAVKFYLIRVYLFQRLFIILMFSILLFFLKP